MKWKDKLEEAIQDLDDVLYDFDKGINVYSCMDVLGHAHGRLKELLADIAIGKITITENKQGEPNDE